MPSVLPSSFLSLPFPFTCLPYSITTREGPHVSYLICLYLMGTQKTQVNFIGWKWSQVFIPVKNIGDHQVIKEKVSFGSQL
jgi:hypothetical protein